MNPLPTNTYFARRHLLGLGPLALASCRTASGEYFGNTTPPSRQRLIFENQTEPDTFDPATSNDGSEDRLLPSMIEGLTTLHPVTMQPAAGMATHYEVSPDFKHFTFYLRGHSNPRGIRLPNTFDHMPRRDQVPADNTPARWSDGTPVTAHDFVYSWRRVVTPSTGSGFGSSYLLCIENAKQILDGKLPPHKLGVAAKDTYTFELSLHTPAPYLLSLLWVSWFCPVPPHVVEKFRKAGTENQWTAPANIVVNGPFTLSEWRPNERILLRRNPNYYAASMMALEEVIAYPTREEQSFLNLYKSGGTYALPGNLLTPLMLPALVRKRDLKRQPASRLGFYSLHTTKPPFNDPKVRYAFNMALNKAQIAGYLGGGQTPAAAFVPPTAGYPRLTSLPVSIEGRVFDVLAFDPAGARALLAQAGYPGGVDSTGKRLSFSLITGQRPRSVRTAEILQAQWRETLGVEMSIRSLTENSWIDALTKRQFDAMVEDSWSAFYLDPIDFLTLFAEPAVTGTWTSDLFEKQRTDANSTTDPAERLMKLAECEKTLMRGMPLVPLYFDSYNYLQKPFVRGLFTNAGNVTLFKYAWIDTNWRPN